MHATPQYAADPHAGSPISSGAIRGRLNALRNLFERLGFEEEAVRGYLKFSRRRHDRKITLTAGARSKNRYLTPAISRRVHTGFTLSVQSETKIHTRLLFTNAESKAGWLITFLQRRLKCTDIGDIDGRYPGFRIWASEPDWAARLLSRSDVRQELTALLTDGTTSDEEPVRHVLSWQPGTVCGTCSFTPQKVPSNLSEEVMTGWLDRIETIVRTADTAPPTLQAEPTWFARQIEKGNLPTLVTGFLLGVPLALLVLAGVAATALAVLFALIR